MRTVTILATPKNTDAMNDKWEFYQDKAGEWRWRRTASNGEIVGAATEGYENYSSCEANAIRNGYIKQ